MKKILLLAILFTFTLTGCNSTLKNSSWYVESAAIVKDYNENHQFFDNGMEIWSGRVDGLSGDYKNIYFTDTKCLLSRTIKMGIGGPLFLASNNDDDWRKIQIGDKLIFIGHRGMKGQLVIIRIAKIENDIPVPLDKGLVKTKITGLDLTTGKTCVIESENIGDWEFFVKETWGEGYSKVHQEYELSAPNQRKRIVPFETLKNDVKEVCSYPEVIFYEMVLKFNPPKAEVQEMYKKLLELYESNCDGVEPYLKERQKYYENRL